MMLEKGFIELLMMGKSFYNNYNLILENNLTKLLIMCIIKIGNKHTECMLSLYSKQHYIAVPKQNVVLFYLFLIISPKYVYNC